MSSRRSSANQSDKWLEVNVLATIMNGKVVHEEAVNWEPPKDLIKGDIIGCHD